MPEPSGVTQLLTLRRSKEARLYQRGTIERCLAFAVQPGDGNASLIHQPVKAPKTALRFLAAVLAQVAVTPTP